MPSGSAPGAGKPTPVSITTLWAMRVVWPAFIGASVMELLVFAMVDPHDLQWFGLPLQVSRQGAYTIAFFVFWLVFAGAGALTAMLAQPVETPQETP